MSATEVRWDHSNDVPPLVQVWVQHVDQLGRNGLYPCVGRLQAANLGALHLRLTTEPAQSFARTASMIVVIETAEETLMLLARPQWVDRERPRDVTMSIVVDRERTDALVRYHQWLSLHAPVS
jgi:hypothetical protein